MIQEILDGAKALGACNKTDGITTAEQLASLFFSPQGREFCAKHNYPTLQMWREIKQRIPNLEDMGIYVDAKDVEVGNREYVAFIGETTGCVSFTNNDCVYHLILQHGAQAEVRAQNYAVYEVLQYDKESHCTNTKDNTAIKL
jgi:hypothetical protein